MEQYLTRSKQIQEDLSQSEEVHVVLGNESCDLDSAVSAIVYSYYLSKKHQDIPVIPILNIQQAQYLSHTEVTHLFTKLNIPAESLTFRDQLKLESLHAAGRLKLHLVDHNVLTGSDVIYQDCVTTVIDHHKRECPEKEGVTVKLDIVGSCATLVAEELLDDQDFRLDYVVAELLFGTILVDTINRSPEAGKITPRDQNVLDQLQAVIPSVKGDNLYQELQTAKFDISGLPNMDLLEKDLKMVPGSGMTIAMSSVTMEMEDLLKRPDFQQDLADFSTKKGADVVVIMTLTMDANDVPTRQIAVYSQHRIYKDQIADVLDNATEDNLELEPCFAPFDSVTVFKQGNVQASRKKVMPILKSFLQGDITPDVTSKEFATQLSVSMATEGFSSLSPMQNGEGSYVSFGEGGDSNSSHLDIDGVDPLTNVNVTSNSGDITEPGAELFTNRLASIPEDVDFNGDNVDRLGNSLPNTLSSTNFSSVNSSNIFDFPNSDSELVDPFSSVEDNLTSLPNQTDTSLIETTDNAVGGPNFDRNQSLIDITFDNQPVSFAQASVENQSILDVTDGLTDTGNHSLFDLVDNQSESSTSNQSLFDLTTNQSASSGNHSLLDFTDNQSGSLAQTADSSVLTTNPFFDVTTDTSLPSLNNFTNTGGGDNSNNTNNNDNLLDGVKDDNGAENGFRDMVDTNDTPVTMPERDIQEPDLLDTGSFESQSQLGNDSNNPFGISSNDPFGINNEEVNVQGDNSEISDSGLMQNSNPFGDTIGNTFSIDSDNPFGVEAEIENQVRLEGRNSSISADLVYTGSNESQNPFANDADNPFGIVSDSLSGNANNQVNLATPSDSVDTGMNNRSDPFGMDTVDTFGSDPTNPFGKETINKVNAVALNSDMDRTDSEWNTSTAGTVIQDTQNPFGVVNDNSDVHAETNPFGIVDDNSIVHVDSNPFEGNKENPFGIVDESNLFEDNKANPFDLSPDVSVAVESQFEDMPEGESPFPMDYLDIGSTEVNGTKRPKARKSISLIVEMDEHSTERLDEFNEADFFDKVPTPDIQHSGETSPFVNSGVSSPLEGLPTPIPGALSVRGSGYPSVSTPPNSVAEGSGFETTDHDLPSFNSAEMVERIHRKKASLGNIADFQGIDIDGKASTPYTPRNSFRDDLPLPSVNLVLPDVENSEMEHTIREKRHSLIAAQDFTSAEDYLLGLSRGTEQNVDTPEQQNQTELNSTIEANPVLANSRVDTNNPLDTVMNSDSANGGSDLLAGADIQNNIFDSAIDSLSNPAKDRLSMATDIDPFTPSNSYIDSTGASFMEGRHSLPNSELFDRLSDLKRQRSDTDSFPNLDSVTSDHSDHSVDKPMPGDGDMNDFDPFFTVEDTISEPQTDLNPLENKPIEGGVNNFDPFSINESDQDRMKPNLDEEMYNFQAVVTTELKSENKLDPLDTTDTNDSFNINSENTVMKQDDVNSTDINDPFNINTENTDVKQDEVDTTDINDPFNINTENSVVKQDDVDTIDTNDPFNINTENTDVKQDEVDTTDTSDPFNINTENTDVKQGDVDTTDTNDPFNISTDNTEAKQGDVDATDTDDPFNINTENTDVKQGEVDAIDTSDPFSINTENTEAKQGEVDGIETSDPFNINTENTDVKQGEVDAIDTSDPFSINTENTDVKQGEVDAIDTSDPFNINTENTDVKQGDVDTIDINDPFNINTENTEAKQGDEDLPRVLEQTNQGIIDHTQELVEVDTANESDILAQFETEGTITEGDGITQVETEDTKDESEVLTQLEAKGSTDENDVFAQFEAEMLQTAESDVVQNMSSTVTHDLLNQAVDIFPDMSNPAVAEYVTTEILTDTSDWTEQGSGDSGIGSSDSPQQGAQHAPPKSPRAQRRSHVAQYSLETDYLPSMDPLHGNLNIVTSPSSSQSVVTDAGKEVEAADLGNHVVSDMERSSVVEGESFRKMSFDGDPYDESGGYVNDAFEGLAEIAEKSVVTDIILSENLKQSQDIDLLVDTVESTQYEQLEDTVKKSQDIDLLKDQVLSTQDDQFEDTVRDATHTVKKETKELVTLENVDHKPELADNANEVIKDSKGAIEDEFNLPQSEEKLEEEFVVESESVNYLESKPILDTELDKKLELEDNGDNINLQSKDTDIEGSLQTDLDDMNIQKDSESMLDEDEVISSPEVSVDIMKDSESLIEEELASSPDGPDRNVNMMKLSESMIEEEGFNNSVESSEERKDNDIEMIKQDSEEAEADNINSTNINVNSFNDSELAHTEISQPSTGLLDDAFNIDNVTEDRPVIQKPEQVDKDSEDIVAAFSNNTHADNIGFKDDGLPRDEPPIPPSELPLSNTNLVDNPPAVKQNPVEIHVEGCSISPDSSNSYNSSTDSEVDLITVKENIIDSSPTDVHEANTDTYNIEQFSENAAVFEEPNADLEMTNKNVDESETEIKAKPIIDESSNNSHQLPDIVMDTHSESTNLIDNTLLDITSSQTESNLIESTLTIETISPAETPDHEHISGFYEVNPEVKQVKGEGQDMDKSVMETNLGDNVTGFYEVNPEAVDDDLMVRSDLTFETISPVDTPSEEEHVTGLYEVNPDDNKAIDNDLLEESVLPLETATKEHTEDFGEINTSANDGLIDNSSLPGDNITLLDTSDRKPSTGLSELNPEGDLINNPPEISVLMTESTETENSDMDSNVGFYEMNSEIQGTVLQNIEIGDAFSPAESPNDDIIGMSYKINPMIPDLPTESSNETDDNDKSDLSVFESYTENNANESHITDAVLFHMADELVNEAIKGAFEDVQVLQGGEETDIADKLADAMLEDDKSSDESSEESDVSSTTTEGSYRIDCSPVMTPESESMLEENVRRMKNKEVYVIEEALNEENENEVEDVMTLGDTEATLFKELDRIDEGNVELEEESVPSAPEPDIPHFTEDRIDEGNVELEEESVPIVPEPDIPHFTENRIEEGNVELEEEIEEESVVVAPEQDVPQFTEDNLESVNSLIIQHEDEQRNVEVGEEKSNEDVKEGKNYEEVKEQQSNEEAFSETQGQVDTENIVCHEKKDNTNVSEEIEEKSNNINLNSNPEKVDQVIKDEMSSVLESHDAEHKEIESTKLQSLVRQETVIPDIVIIPDDTENITDSEGDSTSETRNETDIDNNDLVDTEQGDIKDKQGEEHSVGGSVDKEEPRVIDNTQKETNEVANGSENKTDTTPELETSSDRTAVPEDTNVSNVSHDTGARSKHSGVTSAIGDNKTGARSKHSSSAKVHKSDKKSVKEDSSVAITKSKLADQEYLTRKEIFYTTAGHMSVSIDSVVDPPGVTEHGNKPRSQNPISEETMQLQVAYLLAQIRDTSGQVDEILDDLRRSEMTSIEGIHGYLLEKLDLDLDTLSLCSQPDDDFDPLDLKDGQQTTGTIDIQQQHQQQQQPTAGDQQQQKANKQRDRGTAVKNNKKKHEGKMKEMEDTQEWHEDPIPGMGVQEEESSDSESETDSDSEYGKPVRPDSLLSGKRRKKKISANSNMVTNDDDVLTPDDLDTPDDMEGELEWEDDTPITPSSEKKFADYIHSRDNDDDDDERKDYDHNPRMKKVEIAGKDYKVDMHVIEPYKKVLSHGGYYGDGLNAIILFCGCYLPDRSRRDYQYVMDNLFLYVISTLELLVAEDYMIVYFHGATPRRQMPSFGWLKRCYQMIDRRLRKNLKALLMVHPTLWLKTVVVMTKPFISSKFSSKLRFVKTLQELGKIVPMEYIYVPDPVQQYDTKLKQQRNSSSSTSPATPISPT